MFSFFISRFVNGLSNIASLSAAWSWFHDIVCMEKKMLVFCCGRIKFIRETSIGNPGCVCVWVEELRAHKRG
jgi:hypothetical protein